MPVYDEAYAWAEQVFDALPDQYPEDAPFAARLNNLIYGAQLSRTEDARGLLVQLWGSPGPDGPRPMLFNPDLGRSYTRHTLTISDPTLFLDPDLNTGVYLGEEGNDPILGAISLINSVAASLGVGQDDIVLTGASSGGFAAVMIACRTGWKAIAVNPQLLLPAIHKAPAAPILLNRFRPGIDAVRFGKKAPLRALASSAYADARLNGREPKIALFQNTIDIHHYEKHFIPFCARLKVGPRGGLSKDRGVLARVMTYPAGHAAPYEVRTLSMIDGLAFFYPPGIKERKKMARLFAETRVRFGVA